MQKPVSVFGNNDFKNTTWGDYVLQHPEEDVYLEGPPQKAATYKAKTRAAHQPMVTEPIPENYLNEMNLMRRKNDEADLLREGLTYKNIYGPRRSPSPTRRRSPSPRRRRSPSPRRRRLPSPRRRRASPRRRSPSPTRRRASPLRYMRASDGRLINEFGRNVPRFYNERSRTYRLPRRYNATDRY